MLKHGQFIFTEGVCLLLDAQQQGFSSIGINHHISQVDEDFLFFGKFIGKLCTAAPATISMAFLKLMIFFFFPSK